MQGKADKVQISLLPDAAVITLLKLPSGNDKDGKRRIRRTTFHGC
jgi:hypothetical protein